MIGPTQAAVLPWSPRERRRSHHRTRIAQGITLGILLLTVAAVPLLRADDSVPLHARLDQVLEESLLGTPAPAASDGEFLRRVYLDLTGRIPDTATTRAYLADTSPTKQADVIDRLLESPEHVRHLANVFDLMLMERRPAKHVTQAEWDQYLLESFANQKPYHQLVKELLSSDGTDAKLRGAARFVLDREVEPNLLTRDISRIFLGRDIQCSQCHDHPLIDDYYQAEYYGLYAFVGRSSLFVDAKNENKAYIAEKGEGDVSYKSVFTEVEGESRPQLLNQSPLDEPVLAPGDEYLVKPDKDVRPIPRNSRRALLAEELARGDHPAFRRNLANRLWAWMMGRGLIEPIDLHHAENVPQHALALDLLADELAERNFNIREILREMALTRAYQRSIEPAKEWLAQIEAGVTQLPAVEKMLADALESRKQAAERHSTLLSEIRSHRAETEPQRQVYGEARQAEVVAAFAAREATTALEGTLGNLAAREAILAAVDAAATAGQLAAEKLPDEADLVAATAQFTAKAEAITAEVAGLTAKVEEQRQAEEAAGSTWTEAKQTLAEAEPRYRESTAPIEEREGELELLARELQRSQNHHQVVERQLTRIRALQSRIEPLVQYETARKELDEVARQREQEELARRELARDEATAGSEDPANQQGIHQQKLAELDAELVQLEQQAAELEKGATAAQQELEDLWTQQLALAPLKSLSPEQLAWSILQATGVLAAHRQAVEKELDDKPETAELDAVGRAAAIEQGVYEKLLPSVQQFITLFGAGAGQPQNDFFSTVDQALFFTNGGPIQSWLKPSGQNLAQRLLGLEDPREIAEELFLSVLTRLPSDGERDWVSQSLAGSPDAKAEVVQDLAWALLTSTEFRFCP